MSDSSVDNFIEILLLTKRSFFLRLVAHREHTDTHGLQVGEK